MGRSLSTFFLSNLMIGERQRVDHKIGQSRDGVNISCRDLIVLLSSKAYAGEGSMKKMLFSVLLASQITISVISSEEIINYQNFQSISEVIYFESEQIDSFSENNPHALSES